MKATPTEAATALKTKLSGDGRVLTVEAYGNGRLLVIVKPGGYDALGVGSGRLRRFQGYEVIIRATKTP